MDSDILTYFTNNYSSDFHFELCPVPTYLSEILFMKKDILLVYKKNVNNISSCPSSPGGNQFDTTSEKDLTGSPLKLESDVSIVEVISENELEKFWLNIEESHFPIPIDRAREFLNAYNLSPKTLNVDGLFVICDRNDPTKAAFLGTSSYEGFLGSHIITFEGYQQRTNKSVSIASLLQKHNKLAEDIEDGKTKVETSCQFEIYGHRILEDQIESSQKNGSVMIEVNWSEPSYEPPNNSKAVGVIQCILGHNQSEALLISASLDLLQKYIDIAEEYEGVTDVQVLRNIQFHSYDENIDFVDLISNVFIKFDEMQQLRQLAQLEINEKNNLQKAVVDLYAHRRNLDFTDELWNILTKCSCYTDLSDCFKYIYKEIIQSHISLYVDENNNTSLAKLIRNIGKSTTIVQELSGTEPIEMLIEIGIEKMRKDYLHLFLTCDLPIGDYLKLNNVKIEESHNTNTRKSVVNEKRKSLMYSKRLTISANQQDMLNLNVSKQKFTKIVQIYAVTEILLLIEKRLCTLPKSTFNNFAKEALNYFAGENSPIISYPELQSEPLHTFQVDIPLKDITLDNTQTIWKMILTTEGEYSGLKTTYVQSIRSLFPPSIYDITLKDNVTQELDRYHCIEYNYFWNKFF